MKKKRNSKSTGKNKKPENEPASFSSSRKGTVQLPEAVAKLMRGNVIDLSGASKFYKQKANVATLLDGFVEPLPNSCFRLDRGFESYFLLNLHLLLRSPLHSVADSVAEALFVLGRQWARIDYGKLPLASIPSDAFLRSVWSGAEEWEAFVQRDGCVGEVWLLALC